MAYFLCKRSRVIKVDFSVTIPDWLARPFVWLVLLYRRLHYGYPFRLIRLGQGQYSKVDPEDYEWLNKYDWHLYIRYRSKYAARMDHEKNTFVHMHRMIMNSPKGMLVDHINCDGLDNRRANLRLATRQQNKYNSRPSRGGTSRYKGVFWAKDRKKWRVAVTVKGKTIRLGQFDNEVEAAKVRDAAAKKYHGQFAWLNFPND